MTSFKTINVTLKYAWFLNIGILALSQEKTFLIVSKLTGTISRRIVSEWYASFVFLLFCSLNLTSLIICMSIRVIMSAKGICMQTSMKIRVLSDSFQFEPEMMFL